jgi:hypothetical protein
MALNSLFTNKKFLRLARVLNIPEPHILGYLEFLWHSTYANCDPNIGDSIDVEVAARWNGEAGILTKALKDVGFIDKVKSRSEYIVHDWLDHVPPYVRKKLARKSQYVSSQRETNGRPVGDQWQDSGSGEGDGTELNRIEKNGSLESAIKDEFPGFTQFDLGINGPHRYSLLKMKHLKSRKDLDYDGELDFASQWLLNNPTKASKKKDLIRFLDNWMKKAISNMPPPPKKEETAEEMQERLLRCGIIEENGKGGTVGIKYEL